jgi:hypothetical protein
VEKIYEAGRDGTFGHESADALTLRQLGDRYFTKYVSPKTGRQLGRNERYRWNVMIETKVLDHANISTSSRYLKPSKLALHTTIQRIDAQRRERRSRKVGAGGRQTAEKPAGGATKRATSW